MQSPQSQGTQELEAKDHYPFITRLLIDLYLSDDLPNVQSVEIEPIYGYVGRLIYHDGTVRFFRGTSMGINRLGASEVAKDKGYTKFFLEKLGYRTPRGRVFLFPKFEALIDKNLGRYGFKEYSSCNQILEYIDATVSYPCYLKPNEGSQGRGIEYCMCSNDVKSALENFESSGAYRVLVEEAVPFPDYRVVVLGDEVISCYLRKPLHLTGDGFSTVQELLERRQSQFVEEGRDTIINTADPRIDKQLSSSHLARHSVLPEGKMYKVFQVSNLSVGGESEDFTDSIHPSWKKLCVDITAAMGLRLCGVDLACEDITRGESDYSILEINAAPGLDNYSATGPKQANLVRNLYKRLFNESAEV